ncbi:MAG: hypothetical protein GY715_07760 [Planctomycetes bacterium]|nr:hypothetical protein [Planctomycetota bacterium]
MVQVEIVSEREEVAGWSFVVQVLDEDGTLRRHDVRMSWADYNLWSPSGGDEPVAVVAAVVRFMVSRLETADDLPSSFDASIARRRYEGADEVIPTLIG